MGVGNAREGIGEVFVDEVDDGEDGDEENKEHRYCSCERGGVVEKRDEYEGDSV